ncbi:MAG: SRPBCC family protein [Gemmatimonadota bacterium]|nr:SRPBCC family protein [Gemmatimonadota bacterium]
MTSNAATATGTTTQVYRIFIKATPQAIWDALTKPEWTQRWGYGLRDEYDLRPGGQYRGYANEGMIAMGMSGVIVDGEVIEADPPRKLVITWRMAIDPSMASEGFTRLTYEIVEGRDGVSRLSVIHDLSGTPGHAAMVAGDQQGPGAGGGWTWILSDLKSLLERGNSMST